MHLFTGHACANGCASGVPQDGPVQGEVARSAPEYCSDQYYFNTSTITLILTHTHTHTHTHTRTRIHTYLHTYVYTHITQQLHTFTESNIEIGDSYTLSQFEHSEMRNCQNHNVELAGRAQRYELISSFSYGKTTNHNVDSR